MSDSATQSPLGINVLGALLQNQGFWINPKVRGLVGASKTNTQYTPGEIINNTSLYWLTYAINTAWNKALWNLTNDRPEPINALVAGRRYSITSIGNSDFTTIGAGTNTVGTVFIATGPGAVTTLLDVTITGTGGTFSCTPSTRPLAVGQSMTISGIPSGTGSITGYVDPTVYYIIATNGSTKFTLSASYGGPAIGTTAGTPTGLTYTVNPGYAAECDVDNTTYENLINIGQSRIPALGNSPPPTYLAEDPSGIWNGEATSGYGIDSNQNQGQSATWFPFDTSNPNLGASQWGWLRLIALQAWNEYNYNGETVTQDPPQYQYFTQSFLTAQGFIDSSNKTLYAIQDSKKFLQGIYSNMDDLTSSDITGVSLASRAFGQDLLNLGKALDLSTISTFGLPSNLLRTLKKSNAVDSNLSYALLASGFTASNLNQIFSGVDATVDQEQAIYGALCAITQDNLKSILNVLNCKTKGLESLADLLSVRKLFPISYPSLTVPVYNTVPGPTNSKTYYLLFINGHLNPQLIAPGVVAKVPTVVPPIPTIVPPPIIPKPPIKTVEQVLTTPSKTPDVLPTSNNGGGGGCVALESFMPMVETKLKHNGRPINYAWQLEKGMTISLGNENLEIVNGEVVNALNDLQPCVRISTADGISLVCSTTAPICTKEAGFIPAPETYGKRVAVMRNGVAYYDEVVHIEDVGEKFVRVLDTGNNSFWAGATPDGYILHHNVIFNDTLNYNKF